VEGRRILCREDGAITVHWRRNGTDTFVTIRLSDREYKGFFDKYEKNGHCILHFLPRAIVFKCIKRSLGDDQYDSVFDLNRIKTLDSLFALELWNRQRTILTGGTPTAEVVAEGRILFNCKTTNDVMKIFGRAAATDVLWILLQLFNHLIGS
jgi:hypothetical protein